MTPLERLYPTRCYDCLKPTEGSDDVLCAACKAAYASRRRQSATDHDRGMS